MFIKILQVQYPKCAQTAAESQYIDTVVGIFKTVIKAMNPRGHYRTKINQLCLPPTNL